MRALEGVVVATTRAEDSDDALLARLRTEGADVVSWPAQRFAPARDHDALQAAVKGLQAGAFEWVAFTSPRAVGPVTKLAPTPLPRVSVAAVGPRTAGTLRTVGWSADVVGAGGAAELVQAMAKRNDLRGTRVLFAAGSLARPTLQDALAESGARVTRIEAYHTEPVTPDAALVRAGLESGVDVVVFTSPSGVDGLARALGDGWPTALSGCATVAIGRSTAGALVAAGVEGPFVAGEPSAKGLAEACRRAVARELAR